MELALEQMLPRVILVRDYDTVQMRHRVGRRISEFYELSFYTGGTGKVIIQGAEYPISRGAIRFSPPGISLSSIPEYRCVTVYFDFGDGQVYHNPILDGIPCFFFCVGIPDKGHNNLLTVLVSAPDNSELQNLIDFVEEYLSVK